MNRNIILYVLIALLVVVGGTWYALSTRSTSEGRGEDLTEEEQDNNEDAESDDEDADGGSASNGGTDTGTGTSVNGGTSDDSAGNGGSTSPESNGSSEGVSSGSGHVHTGVGGSEVVSLERQSIGTQLYLQLEVVSSIVTLIGQQLESGELSVDDASDLLSDATEIVEALEDSVEAYLALQ